MSVQHAKEYYELLVYEPDDSGRYRLKPNQRLPHITINETGYRGKPFTGREKVLLLGDSVTFGVGASNDEERFPRYLECASGEPVADASVRAYRVFQHYAELPLLLQKLPRVQTVILWCGYADLLYWVSTGGRVEGAFAFEKKYGRQYWQRQLIQWPLRLMRLGRGSLSEGDNCVKGTAGVAALADHVSLHIRAIGDICRNRQIEIKVLLQPFVRSQPRVASLVSLMQMYNRKTLEKCGIDWYTASSQFVEDVTAQLSQSPAISLIDCQSLVQETDFLDQVHLHERALERLASQVVREQKRGYQTV